MYIHLGKSTVVPSKSLIGIFDLDSCSIGKRTREFLKNAQVSGGIVNVAEDLPKSFIVCKTPHAASSVYISPLSPATFKKRLAGQFKQPQEELIYE